MALFVTATGTGVGKTWVACGLLRRHGGLGLKPVVTGYVPEEAAISDSGRLLAAMGRAVTPEAVAAISPWRYPAPLSPEMAAAAAGCVLPFDALLSFCRQPGVTLIEGVGGVAVPLDARHTVLDWMAALGHPVLLVAGSYLGTISHTLTALTALRGAGLAVRAVVLNESAEPAPPLAETAASLRRHGAVPVSVLRRGAAFEAAIS